MSETPLPVGYWAVVNRGLEPVAQTEVEEGVPGATGLAAGYRRISFQSTADPAELIGLRTVDDLFVAVATWEPIDHRRFALQALGDLALDLDLRDAAAVCREIRDLGTPPTFSVTVNFVGRRNYSTDEIKAAVASGVEAGHGWSYQSRDIDADLNIRVFMEHRTAYVGLRLSRTPLHERPYKLENIVGSLKPTVAAAMVRLGTFAPGATIVDPLCGAGTILLEAAAVGLQAVGGDQDVAALDAARRNRDTASFQMAIEQWDARALPFGDATVDGVVSNLPWGRQIAVEDELAQAYAAYLQEMGRVVRPGGRLVLLTSLLTVLRAAAMDAGLQIESETEISLSGQTPAIFVLVKSQ
jgi:23S rRNA G2445 N2-methylase RlmL